MPTKIATRKGIEFTPTGATLIGDEKNPFKPTGARLIGAPMPATARIIIDDNDIEDVVAIADRQNIRPEVVARNIDIAREYDKKQQNVENSLKLFARQMEYFAGNKPLRHLNELSPFEREVAISMSVEEAEMYGYDISELYQVPVRPSRIAKEFGKGAVRLGQNILGFISGTVPGALIEFIEYGGIALDEFTKLGASDPDQIYNPYAAGIISAAHGLREWYNPKAARQYWVDAMEKGYFRLDPELANSDPISYMAGELSPMVASSALSVLVMYLTGGTSMAVTAGTAGTAGTAITLLDQTQKINRGLVVLSTISAAGAYEHADAVHPGAENFLWKTVHALADGTVEYTFETGVFDEIIRGAKPWIVGAREALEELFTGLFQNTRAGILENKAKGMSDYRAVKDAVLKALKQAPMEVVGGFIGGYGISKGANLIQIANRALAKPVEAKTTEGAAEVLPPTPPPLEAAPSAIEMPIETPRIAQEGQTPLAPTQTIPQGEIAAPAGEKVAPPVPAEEKVAPQTPEDAQRALSIWQLYLETGDPTILEDMPPGGMIHISPEQVSDSLAATLDTPAKRAEFKKNLNDAINEVEKGEAERDDLINEVIAYQKTWGDIDPLSQDVLRYIGVEQMFAKPEQPQPTPAGEKVEKKTETQGELWGSKNTGVTRSEYEEILKRRTENGKLKGGRQSGGTTLFSPEEWADLIKVGLFHLEAGARTFNEWAARVAADCGEPIHAHIPRLWQAVNPGAGSVDWLSSLRNAIKVSNFERRYRVLPKRKIELKKRIGAMAGTLDHLIKKGVPSREAIWRSMGKLRGELADKTVYKPISEILDPWMLAAAEDDIATNSNLTPTDRIHLTTVEGEGAYDKLLTGQVLTPADVRVLQKWNQIISNVAKERVPRMVIFFSYLEQCLGLLKLKAGFDVQIRRQAILIAGQHPDIYERGKGVNLAAYLSKRAALKYEADVANDGNHPDAVASGARFLSTEADIEQFSGRVAEKIPFKIGKAYKASIRGYVAAFNWVQQQLWNAQIEEWQTAGVAATEEMKRQLADVNNTLLAATPAKTTFGKAMRRVMTPVLWSPTVTWSRLRTPGMFLTDPVMRRQLAWTISRFLGKGAMFIMAARIIGGWFGDEKDKDEISTMDYTSTDFLKIKLGNTRHEVFGDLGPYIRAVIQTITQQKTGQGKRRRDLKNWYDPIRQAAMNKRSPWVQLLYKFSTDKEFWGGPAWQVPESIEDNTAAKYAYLGGELIYDSFMPLFLESGISAMRTDGALIGASAMINEFMSGQTLTYEPGVNARMQIRQDVSAAMTYGRVWDDLSPSQQHKLRRLDKEIVKLEKEADEESARWGPPEEISLKEQNEAADRVQRSLSKNAKNALRKSNLRVSGLSRKIGDFWLNNDRYERYQILAADEIEKLIEKSIKRTSWQNKKDDVKRAILKENIEMGKEWARNKLMRGIEKGDL